MSRRRTTHRRLLALIAAAGLAAGCASTTQRDVDVEAMVDDDGATASTVAGGGASTGASQPGDAPAGAAGASGGPGGSPGAAGATSAGAAGGAPTAAGGAATGGGSVGSASGAGSGGPAGGVSGGPGVTDTEIKVGFMVTANLQAGFAAVGASGQPPEERDLYSALVDSVNAGGGFAGRTVVPVVVEVDALGNWQAQADAACATFTDDNRVAVVVSSVVGGSDALAACLANKGVPLVEQNHWLWDKPYWDRLGPLLYQPSRMSPDRWIPNGVATLAAGGFFEKGHRLGLVRFDAPVFERLANGVMKPALAAEGANLVEEAAIATPGGAGDFGGVSAQIGNALLRFRGAGVTHVVFLENAGILPFFWGPASDSQGYHPRIGLFSADLPATQSSQLEPAVLERSLAAAWAPAIDVLLDDLPESRAVDACDAVFREKGVDVSGVRSGFYHLAACDAMFFLRAALDAAPALDANGLRQAVEGLGDTYVSPYSFGPTRFGPGRHDGAAAMTLAAYDGECECYRYRGEPREVP